jgi:hypothetical protein
VPNEADGGKSPWELVRHIAAFALGAYLLIRTPNPSTVVGFVSLVLMGFLPAGLLLRYFNGNGKK